MKYDLKKVMKLAWTIVRKVKCSMSVALKNAWRLIKKEVALKKENYRPDGSVSWNIWTGYGKFRAYYECSFFSNYKNNKGNYELIIL